MTDPTIVNALPKLPGYTFSQLSQPVTYNKPHIFDIRGGVPSAKAILPAAIALNGSTTVDTCGFPKSQILAAYPQWASLSDKVLRFFGYFVERIAESSIEKCRVRKVSILFYLSDGAVAVSETPAVPNSGLKPGTLMSRHVEASVNATKLTIGGSFELRSRVFTIVDCDAATRQFYSAMGCPQPEPLEYPPDTFESLQTKPKSIRDADHIQMKRSVEMQAAALTGHQASFLTPEERDKARNFLDHDREVLRFSAVWNNRHFRIQYYLSDNTVAVMNDIQPNSGRDLNPVFLRRQKAPVGSLVHKALDTINVPRSVEPQFMTVMDLATGVHVRLFERDFFIYDCDSFTKQFYMDTCGVELLSYPRPETEGERPPTFQTMEVPPSNGYGSDEDSAQSFRSLVPKPPKKDFVKYFLHTSDILRFNAVHDPAAPEDEDRLFIVCYYVSDDTVSIYEKPARNSGHIGGKIFARSPAKPLQPSDFAVGRKVTLGGRQYRLTALDERTKKFIETGISMGSSGFAAEALLHRVRHALNQRFVRVTEAYRHFSSGQNGINAQDLAHMLKECEIRVDDPLDIQRLMEATDRDRDGVINLAEFLEHVMDQSIVRPISGGSPITTPAAQSFAAGMTYADLQQARAKSEFGTKVLKLFISKLEARRAFIVDTFRIVTDKSLDGLIGVDTFKNVVQEKLGLNLSEEELDALVFKFFFIPGLPLGTDYTARRLTLREFRRIVEA